MMLTAHSGTCLRALPTGRVIARHQHTCARAASGQQQEAAVSRRTANAGLFTALAACIAASPAQAALLGLSPQKDPIQQYKDDTGSVIKTVQESLAVGPEDPNHDAAVSKIRSVTKDWVAAYRKGGNYQGRPSYGSTYTALNALAGHYNNFGPTAPVPKKRLDRINKELADAAKLLERGR